MEELSEAQMEIVNKIYDYINGAGDAGASIRDVAKHLGMGGKNHTATPHLRNLLSEMMKRNWIVAHKRLIKTGRGMRTGWKFYIVTSPQQ